MKTVEVLKRDFSEQFVDLMRNRVVVSGYKYGPVKMTAEKISCVATAQLGITTYLETGNTEYLVDAANYLMFEFMYPSSRPDGHFTATDSHSSMGQVLRKVKPQAAVQLVKEE